MAEAQESLLLRRRIRSEKLVEFATALLQAAGVTPAGARQTADLLVTADLRGVHSHGVYRLTTYIEALERDLVARDPEIVVERESPVSAVLHGGNGLGAVVSERAVEICIEKGLASGMAMVAAHHSTHFSMAGYWAMKALPHDMIGFATTNAPSNMVPTGAKKKALGTNPIAVAIPAADERAFVLDMATSVVSQGKIATLTEQGLPIPEGWALDRHGRPTTDGHAMLDGGSILPLGGQAETSGYKGCGLGALVDILCGPLAGALFGVNIQNWLAPNRQGPLNVGHVFGAVRVDLFQEVDAFKQEVDRLIRQMRGLPRMAGAERIYVAGEKEFDTEEQYRELGIPLPLPEREALGTLAARYGIEEAFRALEG